MIPQHRKRLAKDEIELTDTVMALKTAVERLKTRVDYLADALEDLHAEKDARVPLASWIDEEMFLGAKMNPAVPWLANVYNTRAETALRDARYNTINLSATTTRDLLFHSHEQVRLWRGVGDKALSSIVRALERHGVRWPVKGRKK